MDWGFGNPNMTAAFIVTLMIAAWGLAWFRAWGFWIASLIFTGLGICLVHTFSRGGAIALGAGALPLVWFAPRPWPRKNVIVIACSVWIIIMASIYLQADSRYMQGLVREDRSITHRMDIWKVTPRMMVDAPGGWGLETASKAYEEWYQPLDRGELYLNLLNSHLTWLVEIGWAWRFLYILGWLIAFALCWPDKKRPWFAVPLGIWVGFAVASFFSHVARVPALWAVPCGGLLAVLAARIWRRDWLSTRWMGALAGAAALVLAAVYLVGVSHRGQPIHGNPGQVVIGEGVPATWVVVNPAVMGDGYGKAIRRFLQEAKSDPAVGIVEKLDDLPARKDITVVIAGQVQDAQLKELKTRNALILLNPTFFPQEIDLNTSNAPKSVSVFFGEFSQSPAIQAWRDLGLVQDVQGKGDYLANWPELVLHPQKQL